MDSTTINVNENPENVPSKCLSSNCISPTIKKKTSLCTPKQNIQCENNRFMVKQLSKSDCHLNGISEFPCTMQRTESSATDCLLEQPGMLDVPVSPLSPNETGKNLFSWGGSIKRANTITGGSNDHNLALYEDQNATFLSAYFRAYTTPGPSERAHSKKGKADLGVMLGVYLPTIQHILGVTMFIRLGWCVGVAGIGQTFLMLSVCCFCTFLTCISISAVATNGVIESGGAYFIISRNLGPEFGSAIGLLFYLANTVATSMYLVGGVEILLLYIAPGLTIGGTEVQSDTGLFGMMTHNLRFYATILLLIEFCIVAMGVKFVQLLAPVSLVTVIISILACYAGSIEKTLNPTMGPYVCKIDNHLLASKSYLPQGMGLDKVCEFCNINNTLLMNNVCKNNTCLWDMNKLKCVNGFPGFTSSALLDNLGTNYPGKNEYLHGSPAVTNIEIFQDVRTSFFVLLAIYFPAVTGIFTGANMSGDLKNPGKSIPSGTICAQLTTSFIYFSLALCFGAVIDGDVLRDKNGFSLNGGMVVASLAWPADWILLAGSFLSTFGAALQCLCSAPRLLQGLAKDDVIPILSVFSKVTKNNEPFYGLILTTFIAELAVLLGAMDSIAAVVDFFFLMCYAFVNLICALHSILGAPNWRPRFQYYHWSLSILGAGLCFFIMFSTHWDYAIISCLLCIIIYKYVEWKGAKKEWGDGIRGLALSTAQYSLMKIEDKAPHPKNWRPQLLVLHSMPWSKELVDIRYLNLLHLASQLKAGKGLTIVTSFVRGDPISIEDREHANKVRTRMEFDMNSLHLRGFAKTLLYGENQIAGSLSTLIQSVGIGGLRPNTLLLSWPIHRDDMDRNLDSEYLTFTDKIHIGAAMNMSLIVAKDITDFPTTVKMNGYIDVYWIVQDGGLCILLAYLLKQHRVWRHCKQRVIAVAQKDDNNTKLMKDLQNYVYQLRISADVCVVELSDPTISKNAFERTLLMEERTKFQKELHQQKIEASNNSNGFVNISLADTQSQSSKIVDETLDTIYDSVTSEEIKTDSSDDVKSDEKVEEKTNKTKKTATLAIDDEHEKNKKLRALDRKKVHKMHTAVRLNELIQEKSGDSSLILLNLPRPPHTKEGLDDYIHYMEVLSDKIPRVLFVRGTGQEVITTSS
ncbi:Amino acid permease/ SLC12A domain-containing protein [Strongyloides ratti]|uniref:Amino acid permease/ SLC12A domain-containing protein n=1 Tax=Strongyloides ratti TaxID=34506 RepID=A0A090LP90_STRRB|nr:Amino acid permease/ SLC12A domain-containing protein [Strongyloides ratti]CEF71650.1 Amino acid permease/ SLC12A domain-containing protein [Strongyloides ratti]